MYNNTFNKQEFLKELKKSSLKFTIKTDHKNFNLKIDNILNYQFIIKDFDYVIDKINNSFGLDSLKMNILDYEKLSDLSIDILKQAIKLIDIGTGIIYLSDLDKPFFINIEQKALKNKIKIEIRVKDVLKQEFFICNGNEPCTKRIRNHLVPYNACCGNCELKDDCMLVCNNIKYVFCFDKEKI